MRVVSRTSAVLMPAIAYGFAAYAAMVVFWRGEEISSGYSYLLLLVSVLLLVSAHGFRLIRRSRDRRLDRSQGSVTDVATDLAMSVWEVLLGWLGVTLGLIPLYYAAPVETLEDWYPLLFLCLAVVFGATYQKALVFVCTVLPFVLTITVMALWQGIGVADPLELIGRGGFVLLDVGLLLWAARLARAEGVLSSGVFEMPLGSGRVGGRVSGVIRNQASVMPEGGYQLDLSCIRQTREEGKKANGEILCHMRKVVRGDLPGARFSGPSIPVDFALPQASMASAAAQDERITWTLRASADLDDSTLTSVFEIPVEQAEETPQPVQPGLTQGPGVRPPDFTARGAATPQGTVFKTRAEMSPASELLTASYFVFWAQLMWLATAQALGWEVWLMFAVGMFFLGSLLAPLSARAKTVIGEGGVTATTRYLWMSRTQTIHAALVEAVVVERLSPRAGLIEASAQWGAVVKTREGRKFPVAGPFRERRVAEAIGQEILGDAQEQARAVGEEMAMELQGV